MNDNYENRQACEVDNTAECVQRPIHRYGERKTVSGRVNNSLRIFRRCDGSCQFVFSLRTACGQDGRGEDVEVELYAIDISQRAQVCAMLNSGAELEISAQMRHDTYRDRLGLRRERRFLFADGPESIRVRGVSEGPERCRRS